MLSEQKTSLRGSLSSRADPQKRTNRSSLGHDETSDGFVLYATYRRFQFIPESAAVDAAATSEMLALAHELAEERGRRLEPINEQHIRKSMGRNGFSGITSWSGTVTVTYVAIDQPPSK